ncbi:MAG: hypothetical protein CL600_14980 [Alteromonas sp.]|nr:hypothetical protein [Alteromonas sp.]
MGVLFPSSSNDTRHKIGVLLTYSAISNHLIFLIQSLESYKQVECSAVISQEDMDKHGEWLADNAQGLHKFVFSKKANDALSYFDALILPESNVTSYHFIPSDVIRIGLPHGTDVAVYATLFNYGGGFCFDYILSSIEQPLLPESVYKNTFPKLLRTQQSSSVTLVPFGSPKLDVFVNTVFNNKADSKTSIIYHLSLLSIEESWVEERMLEVLGKLLISFPDRVVIYRVHHLDRENPTVKACLEMASRYNNFHFSTDDSYVDDYSHGAMMVLHREYESHLFELATGAPTLLVTNLSQPKLKFAHSERYFSAPVDQFINVALKVIEMPFDRTRRYVEKYCREKGIFNTGRSIASLVQSLPTIISRKKDDSWVSYHLDDCSNEDIDTKLTQLLLSKRTFGHYAFAYANYANYSPISLLLLAEHFVRHSSIESYFYPHALRCFRQVLCHSEYPKISRLAELWWSCKGREVLLYCLKLLESGRMQNNNEIDYLVNFDSRQLLTSKKSGSNNCAIKTVHLGNRTFLSEGEVVVVGVTELTKLIIELFGIHVVAVFDDVCADSHSKFMNKPVYPLSDIVKFSQNIVIGTQNGLVTMANKLTLELGVNNEMYGVIDDLLLEEMISALPKFNDTYRDQ